MSITFEAKSWVLRSSKTNGVRFAIKIIYAHNTQEINTDTIVVEADCLFTLSGHFYQSWPLLCINLSSNLSWFQCFKIQNILMVNLIMDILSIRSKYLLIRTNDNLIKMQRDSFISFVLLLIFLCCFCK